MNYNSIVEDTRKSRCESAIENIKKRLTYINQKFIDELYQNIHRVQEHLLVCPFRVLCTLHTSVVPLAHLQNRHVLTQEYYEFWSIQQDCSFNPTKNNKFSE